jgi:hypothetical protein
MIIDVRDICEKCCAAELTENLGKTCKVIGSVKVRDHFRGYYKQQKRR